VPGLVQLSVVVAEKLRHPVGVLAVQRIRELNELLHLFLRSDLLYGVRHENPLSASCRRGYGWGGGQSSLFGIRFQVLVEEAPDDPFVRVPRHLEVVRFVDDVEGVLGPRIREFLVERRRILRWRNGVEFTVE